jgi:hypothetical protein
LGVPPLNSADEICPFNWAIPVSNWFAEVTSLLSEVFSEDLVALNWLSTLVERGGHESAPG